MSKPLVNNKIVYPNIQGRVATHDVYLNQGVRNTDSPTFGSLNLTGDATVEGNLYVKGNTTILDSKVIEFEDNVIVINRAETGAGVTLNQSGLEIDRGTLQNFAVVYNEQSKALRSGFVGNTQIVATREDSPLVNGIMTFNSTEGRLDSSNNIVVDVKFSSTTPSTSSSTGALQVSGGVGIKNDLHVDGKLYLKGSTKNSSVYTDSTTDSLVVNSMGDIYLQPSAKVQLPYNKALSFGSTSQSISVDSLSNALSIAGSGNVVFSLNPNQRISVPNQIPITFSTPNEKIYTDSANNMVVQGSQDVNLLPGVGKKVFVDANVPLSFGNPSQSISAGLSNDLTIRSGNNIKLIPAAGEDVQIPTDNGITFGPNAIQRVYADSNNTLYIKAGGNVVISPSGGSLVIPSNTAFMLGSNTSMVSDTAGNMTINNAISKFGGQVAIISSQNAVNSTSAALVVSGGVGVDKTIYTASGLVAESNSNTSLSIKRAGASKSTLSVDNSAGGSTAIWSDNSTALTIGSNSFTDASQLVSFLAAFDTTSGYGIGRSVSSDNSGRVLSVNIPSGSSYSSGPLPQFKVSSNNNALFSVEADSGNVVAHGSLHVQSSQDATNPTSGGMVVEGGLAVGKSIIAGNGVVISGTSSNALVVSNVLQIDTVNKNTTLSGSINLNNQMQLNGQSTSILNTVDATDTSHASFIVNGGMSVQKSIRVGGSLDMSNSRITNVGNPIAQTDAVNKSYVDLLKQGLYVKDSVKVATVLAGALATDFAAGNIIDGYTLQAGDRLLIKDQVDAKENGIYIVQSASQPLRAADYAAGHVAAGTFCFVESGNTNAALGWICNSPVEASLVGSNTLNFTQFTGLGQVTPGQGLSKNFNVMNVNVDNSSVEISANALRIKNTAVSTGLTGGSGAPLQTTPNQTHVTMLGDITTGTWEASTIQVPYGGTGNTQFSSGSILYGNGTNKLATSSKLHFDDASNKLGVGTSNPSATIHVESTDAAGLLLNANSLGNSPGSLPSIAFARGGQTVSNIVYTSNNNDVASDVYANSLLLSADNNLHLATNSKSRLTILQNGNVGINTSSPHSALSVNGTLGVSDIVSFGSSQESYSTTDGSVVVAGGMGVGSRMNVGGKVIVFNTSPSTDVNSGAVVIHGGLSVKSNQNAANIGNGGALSVAGGASVGGDLWVGGQINGSGSSSSTFAYLTLTATDEAVNLTSGSMVTFGGITIQATTNSTSVSNGGSFLVAGGASFGSDVYVGGDVYSYGAQYLKTPSNNLVYVYNTSGNNLLWTLQRNTTGDLSLIANHSSNSVGSLSISNSTGSITIQSTNPRSLVANGGVYIANTSDTALVLDGGASFKKGLTVGSTTEATSITSAALITYGGASIAKNAIVGNNLTVLGDTLSIPSETIKTISNTSGSNLWVYFGKLGSGDYQDITLQAANTRLNLQVSVSGTTPSCSHSIFGAISPMKLVLYTSPSNEYHMFSQIPAFTTVHADVVGKGNSFFANEGTSSSPSGSVSGYTGAWQQSYTTDNDSSTSIAIGNATVEGELLVADALPVVGYVNNGTTATRDLGVLYQRYQNDNDTNAGDVVNGTPTLVDTLPDQTTANLNQIKLSSTTSTTDNFYNGWWIVVNSGSAKNEVRKIVSYNGAQHVAGLESPWSSVNPQLADTVALYNAPLVGMVWKETSKQFQLVMGTKSQNFATTNQYADLLVNKLIVSNTSPSTSVSSGALISSGGVSIQSTADCTSNSVGGALSVAGGGSFGKTLQVGGAVGIALSNAQPQETLHLNGNVRIESTSPSYIDMVQGGNNTRFGILRDGNSLNITSSTSSNNPLTANRAITVASNGNVGIGTGVSNINSPLVLGSNQFMSTNASSGFLGLVGGNTNTNDNSVAARLMLYGNGAGGNVECHAGGSVGSLNVFTNNTSRLRIDSTGSVKIATTSLSTSSTAGALVVNGGIAVSSSQNATSYTNGGAMTVAGGVSISKDIYIGGNLYISGSVQAGGSVQTPSIPIDDTNSVNCTITQISNVSLLQTSNEAVLSFHVEVIPTSSSSNCQFQFSLPSRTNTFTTRGEVSAILQGYTDDTNLVPLFNTLCVGVPNTTSALVKFQSASTSIHYFTVYCRYTMA
jgi:hypothetical protein